MPEIEPSHTEQYPAAPNESVQAAENQAAIAPNIGAELEPTRRVLYTQWIGRKIVGAGGHVFDMASARQAAQILRETFVHDDQDRH